MRGFALASHAIYQRHNYSVHMHCLISFYAPSRMQPSRARFVLSLSKSIPHCVLSRFFVLSQDMRARVTKYDPPQPGWHTAVARMKGQRSTLSSAIRHIPTHTTQLLILSQPIWPRIQAGVRAPPSTLRPREPRGSRGFRSDPCGDPLTGGKCVSIDRIFVDTWR